MCSSITTKTGDVLVVLYLHVVAGSVLAQCRPSLISATTWVTVPELDLNLTYLLSAV